MAAPFGIPQITSYLTQMGLKTAHAHTNFLYYSGFLLCE